MICPECNGRKTTMQNYAKDERYVKVWQQRRCLKCKGAGVISDPIQKSLFDIDDNLKDKFERSLTDTKNLSKGHYNFKNGDYTNIYMKDAFKDFKNGIKNRFIF